MNKDRKVSILKILNVVFAIGIVVSFFYLGSLWFRTMLNNWQIPGYSPKQGAFMDFLEAIELYIAWIIPFFALVYSIFYSIRRFLLKITHYSLLEQVVIYGSWLYWLLFLVFLQTFVFDGKH